MGKEFVFKGETVSLCFIYGNGLAVVYIAHNEARERLMYENYVVLYANLRELKGLLK